jgi:DNA polymerase V
MSEESVYVPENVMMQHPNAYILRIRGDCMTGDGIRDGDYVLIDPDEPCCEGDIGVVRVRNWPDSETGQLMQGAVLKHVHDRGRRLVPSNPAHKPMILGPENHPEILGRAIALIRAVS